VFANNENFSNRSVPKTDEAETRHATTVSMNGFSRVLAVMILMVLPAGLGYLVDGWLQTKFCIIIGFVLGMMLGTVGLISVARQTAAELGSKKTRP
jgi:F0F1-type ATP synthase assembly protein I